jgi:hypothetical protein
MLNAVPTTQKTHYVSVTNSNGLILFRDITGFYTENHTKHINMLHEISRSYITYSVNMDTLNHPLTILSEHLNHLKRSFFQGKILSCDVVLLNVFYALFNGAVSNQDDVVSNDRICYE